MSLLARHSGRAAAAARAGIQRHDGTVFLWSRIPGSRAAGARPGMTAAHAALASAALVLAKAQSSQAVSATTSSRSTVAPHQIRRPGGASR